MSDVFAGITLTHGKRKPLPLRMPNGTIENVESLTITRDLPPFPYLQSVKKRMKLSTRGTLSFTIVSGRQRTDYECTFSAIEENGTIFSPTYNDDMRVTYIGHL
jgi:hypothetical protein